MAWISFSDRNAAARRTRTVRALNRGAGLGASLLLLAGLAAPPAHSEPNPLRSGDASLLGVVDSVQSSIVTVVCYPPAKSSSASGGKRKRLIGTAVALSDHRLITTASMAVPGGTVRVLLGGGIERPALLKGVDRQSNIALFSVEGATLRALKQAPPQSLVVGTWVAVISNVAITRPQAALGRIVGRGERLDFAQQGEVLEIDAPVYPGSTGGAVMNEDGDWVAVVVGRLAPSPGGTDSRVGAVKPEEGGSGPNSVLMALPVDQVTWIAKELESYGNVRRGYLGIRLRRTTAASESLGVAVAGVVAGSPAESAGIRVGDRILAIEGQEVHASDEVTMIVRSLRPGDQTEITILRGTEIFPTRATLGAVLPEPMVGPRYVLPSETEQLRLDLQKLEEEKAQLEERLKALESPSGR